MTKPNLLVSFDPAHEGSAKSEIETLLKEVKKEAKFLDTDVNGLFELKLDDAKETVKELKSLCKKAGGMFKYTYHWIPVDTWCKTKVDDMNKIIKSLEKWIDPDEKWKMELEKRNYDKMHTYEMIMKLTDVVNRQKVDLKNPNKIIKVEIIGDHAGISLLKPDEQLSIPRIKK